MGAAQVIQLPDEKQQEKADDFLTKWKSYLPKTMIIELQKIVKDGPSGSTPRRSDP